MPDGVEFTLMPITRFTHLRFHYYRAHLFTFSVTVDAAPPNFPLASYAANAERLEQGID